MKNNKKNSSKILIYMYILACIIPGISNYGINVITGVKVSIVDFLTFFIIIFSLLNKNFVKSFFVTFKRDKYTIKILTSIFLYILFYGLISILIDNMNAANAIRIIRNIFLMLFSCLSLYYIFQNEDESRIIKELVLLSIVASVINIYNYKKNYDLINTYDISRNNETLLISLFIFFIFYMLTNELKFKKKISIYISITLILVAIVTQQERTQILAFVVAGIISFLYYLLFYRDRLKIVSILRLIILILIIIAIMIFLYENNIFFNGLINNYIVNRINLIYNNHNFNADTSISTRGQEVRIIFNLVSQSIINALFGKGIAAQYCLDGNNIAIVDSFWLWTFLDMGLIGVVVFGILFIYLLYNIFKIDNKHRVPVLAFFIATVIMTLFTPNFIYRIDDCISFAILIAIIFKFKIYKVHN